MSEFPEFILKVTEISGYSDHESVEWKVIIDERHLKATIGGLKGKRTQGIKRKWWGYPKKVEWWAISGRRWTGEEVFD